MQHAWKPYLQLHPEVKQALAEKRPVVALESTVLAHGLPYPQNLQLGQDLENILRSYGVTPATCAVINGYLKIGLTPSELEQMATQTDCKKINFADVPQLLVQKKMGATTVSATVYMAHLANIPLLSTGGLGGVHRFVEQSWDISADLTALSQYPVGVVCSGVKSILDIAKTLEVLETLGVPVVGHQTEEFPAFFTRESGFPVNFSLDTPEEMAQYLKVKWNLNLKGGVVLANPIPKEDALGKQEMDVIIEQALQEMRLKKICGKEVTPFLLKKVNELTQGQSLQANLSLLKHNAHCAAKVALALGLIV